MTDTPIAPDDPIDEPVDPEDAPDVIGQKAARLALRGVLLRGILNQHPHYWPVLLSRVKLGHWRTRVEVIEQLDGEDTAFVLEVRNGAGEWRGLVRVHRAQLDLPRLPADTARNLAAMTRGAPHDASELGG